MSGTSACCSSYPECTAKCLMQQFIKHTEENIMPIIKKMDEFVTTKINNVEEDVNTVRTEVKQQGDLLAKETLRTQRQEVSMALR